MYGLCQFEVEAAAEQVRKKEEVERDNNEGG